MRCVAVACVALVSSLIFVSAAHAVDAPASAATVQAARTSDREMKHYRSSEWNFELDIPKNWNSFPPAPNDTHGMVLRFISREDGNHVLGVFRTPYDPKEDPKAVADQVQDVLAKGGLTNFVRSETKIGLKTVITLDSDRTMNGQTTSDRHYFIVDGTVLHILGFTTTNRDAMFPVYDQMAKSFRFKG